MALMTASKAKSRLVSIAKRTQYRSEWIDKEMGMSEVAELVDSSHLRAMAKSLNELAEALEEEELNREWCKRFKEMSPEEKRRAR